CSEDQRTRSRARLQPGRYTRRRQSLSRSAGRATRGRARQGARRKIRNHDSEPDRGDVPLWQPRFRAPGRHRLSPDVLESDGTDKKLLVHRKGVTRAFGPGHEEVAARYREIGQPVIIGGSMETGSYLLVGTASGAETFFSTAHGSGRTMSRTKARKQWHGKQLQRDLEARGIYVRS